MLSWRAIRAGLAGCGVGAGRVACVCRRRPVLGKGPPTAGAGSHGGRTVLRHGGKMAL
jgi:hypothetical protein